MQPTDVSEVDRRVDQLFGQTPRARTHRRWWLAAVAVAVALVAGAAVVSMAGGQDAGAYRTASVVRRDVAARLDSVATIESVSQAAVAFPTAGTVASVDVEVGDTVAVGQLLASLDTEALARTVHQRQEELARAELTLSRALDGEAVDDAADGATAAPASTSRATTSGDGAEVVLAVASSSDSVAVTSTAAADDTQLTALQQAVLDAQKSVDAALAAADAALDAATQVCADLDSGSTVVDEATTSTAATSTAGTGGAASAAGVEACRAALEEVQSAQTSTAAAQQELADASRTLDDQLAALAADQAAAGAEQPTSGEEAGAAGSGSAGGSASGANPSGGSASGGSSSPTASSSPSSADLVAYQKAVDAAQLQVLVAEQALAQAAIVAPLPGTVVAVGFDVGDEVTAASATQTVTIQGDGGVEVVTTIALADIADVAVGQAAAVVPDGGTEPLDGQVVAVAGTPDDDSTTATTSYRVTVGLDDPLADLGTGTTGTVTIRTAGAQEALAVPSSAVTWRRGRAIVTRTADGDVEQVPVEIGVVGADWIEIVSGLEEGDAVVLADLDEPLPGAATEATTSGSTGATGGVPDGFPVRGPAG